MNRRLAYALLAMGAAQAAVYVARPVTSYRLLALGSGSREVGLVTAAFALLPLFLAIPLGRYTDRRDGGPLLTAGCAVQTVACLLLGTADSPLGLAAASALLGLGHLALALGVQAVIARESDAAHHDRHFGLLTAAVSLGQLVGPLLLSLVLGNRRGASLAAGTGRAMFVAAGVAAAATVCAVLAERGRSRAGASAPGVRVQGSVWSIVTTRGVPGGIFVSVAVLSAADVFTAYLPVLGEERGYSPGLVGVVLAVRAAASMASRVGIGAIVALAGRGRLLSLSAVVAAAALAAMTADEGVAALAVLAALAGFGLGFGQPLSMTIVVQRVAENARATALAVRLTGNRVGQVAAPAAAGALAGSAGVSAVFWLMGGLLVVSGLTVPPDLPAGDVVVDAVE